MRLIMVTAVLSALTLGCRSDNEIKGEEGSVDATTDATEDEAEEEEEEEDFSMYDDATLVILAPESGEFLPWEEEADFEAVVFDADGRALPFEDIYWSSNTDMTWAKVGQDFEDDSLDVGTHAITAVADLPNGNRLVYTVGGVLVQHDNAGIYTGDMNVGVTVEFEGTPIGTSCIGGATIIVDAYGETATGESTCTIDLLGYAEFDLRHEFEFDLEDEEMDGEALIAFDLIGFDLPFASEGDIDGGEIFATWGGSMMGIADIEGTLEVGRVSRSVELSD
jgi:hypothetical protein